jgi:hypothetical protein
VSSSSRLLLLSSYSYCTPKLTPLLARHQQQWAKAYLGGTNSLIPVRRPLHGACTTPLSAASAALRRLYCTLFPSVKRLPAPLRASQLGRERERDSEAETQGRDIHTPHTHTHTRDSNTTNTTNALFQQHHLSTSCTVRPPASPIRCTTLNRADSHALTRLARVVRRRIPLHPPRVPADARTCPRRYSNTRFSPRARACRFWKGKSGKPPIGDAEDCIRWTPGLEAWRILTSHAFVNLVAILPHRTTPYNTQCEQTDACELAESHQRTALLALARDDKTVLSLFSHIN